jgi:hypothetical protein
LHIVAWLPLSAFWGSATQGALLRRRPRSPRLLFEIQKVMTMWLDAGFVTISFWLFAHVKGGEMIQCSAIDAVLLLLTVIYLRGFGVGFVLDIIIEQPELL